MKESLQVGTFLVIVAIFAIAAQITRSSFS